MANGASQASVIPALLETLEALLQQLSYSVQSACNIAVDGAVDLSALAVNAKPEDAALHKQIQSARHKILVSLQFQDRHAQVIGDVTALLREARRLLETGADDAAAAADKLAAVVRMGDIRAMLFAAESSAPGVDTAGNASSVELF